ncbi:MAG: thiolase [Chloroflexi bacterium]|nr:thiolase [Chloroflexota bacterium]
MAGLAELRGKVAIVGAAECDEIGLVPNKSTLALHAEAAQNAIRDAGLNKHDIDAVFTAGTSVALLADYLGLRPRYVDGTSVGGCSFVIHVEHAMLALHHGMCNYALISHGESGRSRVGYPRVAPDPQSPGGQFEAPYGVFGPPTLFPLPLLRYMHTFGVTREQLAEVAISTRKWASLNPRAMMRDPITVEDVLNSRLIAYPMTLFMCCLVTDAAGAIILTTAERARDLPKPPVYVIGTGEAVAHQLVSQMADMSWSNAYAQSGQQAFRMAGTKVEDLDFAELYDAFVHTPVYSLDALGLSKPGEGVHFFLNDRAAPGGEFPINTNGGGLSYTHPGMYGMFILVEAVRQLRGEAGARQVKDRRDRTQNATLGLVHGVGGMFSASGTAILGNVIP